MRAAASVNALLLKKVELISTMPYFVKTVNMHYYYSFHGWNLVIIVIRYPGTSCSPKAFRSGVLLK